MFSLAAGLYDLYFSKPEIRILMLGLDGAGKTTLLERIKAQFRKSSTTEKRNDEAKEKELLLQMTKISPTVGLNIGRLEMRGANVIIWDLGGEKSLRGIWERYYTDTHAIVWVVDSADSARFEEAKHALSHATDRTELEGVPLLVLANKSDLAAAHGVTDVQNAVICQERGLPKHRLVRTEAVSGIEGTGVQDIIVWLVDTLKRSARKIDASD